MDKFRKLWVIVISMLLSIQVYAGVKISEVMPCNISTYMDRGSGEIDPERSYNFPGWVELYNEGEEISLKGYKISHCKLKKDGQLEFKSSCVIDKDIKVGASSYQILFFDEDVRFYKHMPFKLDSDGGSIALYKDGELVDSLRYGAMETHISYGRSGSNVGYMNPTPKGENSASYDRRVQKPKFSGQLPGVVSEGTKVTLDCATGEAKTYYTTDGSEPKIGGESTSEYVSSPIEIKETTIIKARTFDGDKPASEILTGTFLVVDKYHKDCGNGFTVPIVSISTDEEYLYDPEIGFLLTEGSKNGVSHPNSSCLSKFGSVNLFQENWKRPVVFEYIEDGKVTMVQEAEASVMGGCSREWKVVSLKLKAGSKVGSSKKEFSKSPFKDKPNNKYTSLHLRNGGNGGNTEDLSVVRVRDGFMQSLVKDMNIDYQAYQPVAYYLNGKYMGLMGLRERTNEDYVESNYGLDEEDIDVLKANNSEGMVVSNGTLDAYNDMIEFLENNDPTTKEYYETACKYIDMDEYIDYQIFEHFIVNTDWPGNNIKIWRDRKNGKFRWITYDTDFGFGLYSHNNCVPDLNTFKFAVGESPIMWSNGIKISGNYVRQQPNWKVTIFYHLTKNPQFQEKFVNKALIHLGTTFSFDRVKAEWEKLQKEVEAEFCAFAKKYGHDNTSLEKLDGAKRMLEFAAKRHDYIYDHMKDFFHELGYSQFTEYVDFKLTSNIDNAKFLVNDDLLNSSSFEGKQVNGIDIKLYPVAPRGYIFKKWEVEGFIGATYPLNSQTEWRYFYQRNSPEGDWTSAEYDDSDWSIGRGKMGYNTSKDGHYDTELDFGEKSLDKYMRAYFRTTLDLTNEYKYDSLQLKIDYDDGFILYLNGKEICRRNIAAELNDGKVVADQNDNDLTTTIYLKREDVIAGKNILAAVLCQKNPDSSDMTWKVDLKAIREEQQGTTFEDARLTYKSTISGNLKVNAIFEKYECDEMQKDYSVLVLNEMAPSNNSETDIVDEYGIHSDWFEIYNSGDDTLNLAGLYLSDDKEDLGKSKITFLHPDSTTILPKGFIRFWADNATYRGALHADFKLGNESNTAIYLSTKCDNSYQIVSKMMYKGADKLPQNASIGYLCNTPSEEYFVFDNTYKEVGDSILFAASTPGASNPPCIEETAEEPTDCEELKNEFYEALDVVRYASNQTTGPNWLIIKNSGIDELDISGKLYISTDITNLAAGLVPDGCKKIAPNDSIVIYVGEVSEIRGDSVFLSITLPNEDSTLIYFSVKCGEESIDSLKAINAFRYNAVEKNGNAETTMLENTFSTNSVQVYPNPTESMLNIDAGETKIVSINLYEGTGRLLITLDVNKENVQLNMSQYATGTYYLQVVTEKEVVQRKILKY